MRRLAMLFPVLAVGFAADGFAGAALAKKIRLAQTSTVTNCMMTCNSQAAMCQATCVLPTPPQNGALPVTTTPSLTASCLSNCSTQQIACQTNCALASPSP